MDIYANGKNIPTHAFADLFVQGEKLADTIIFHVDRVYNNIDLMECVFSVRGLTENGWEVSQAILPHVSPLDGSKIVLPWRVSDVFTYDCGKLMLEMRVSRISKTVGDGEPEESVILKYSMPAVNVRPTIKGNNESPPETAEQAISEINEALSEGKSTVEETAEKGVSDIQKEVINSLTVIEQKASEGLKQIEDALAGFDTVIERLNTMDSNIQIFLARPEVIPMTVSEYAESEHKQNSLYVIVEEVEK